MNAKLQTKKHLELLKAKKEDAQASLSLHMSKYHIVGNHMSRLNLFFSPCNIVTLPMQAEEPTPPSTTGLGL